MPYYDLYGTIWNAYVAIFGMQCHAIIRLDLTLVLSGMLDHAWLCYAMLFYSILWHCNIHLAISDHSLYITKKALHRSCSLSKFSSSASLPSEPFFPFMRRQRLPSTNLKVKSSVKVIWSLCGRVAVS